MMNNCTLPHTIFKVELKPVHTFFGCARVPVLEGIYLRYLTSFHPNGQTCQNFPQTCSV